MHKFAEFCNTAGLDLQVDAQHEVLLVLHEGARMQLTVERVHQDPYGASLDVCLWLLQLGAATYVEGMWYINERIVELGIEETPLGLLRSKFKLEQQASCTMCDIPSRPLWLQILHLNDTHLYTFEQIAAWLEESDFDIGC